MFTREPWRYTLALWLVLLLLAPAYRWAGAASVALFLLMCIFTLINIHREVRAHQRMRSRRWG